MGYFGILQQIFLKAQRTVTLKYFIQPRMRFVNQNGFVFMHELGLEGFKYSRPLFCQREKPHKCISGSFFLTFKVLFLY